MKQIMKYFATVIVAGVAFTSCLDLMPEDAIPEPKAITSLSEANQAVIGIYSDFKSGALYSGLLTLLPDIQSDLVYAVDGFTNTYGDIWRWELLSNSTELTAVYGTLYGVIGDCNFFFDYLPQVRAGLTEDNDIETLAGLAGEVHFMRAMAYSELIRLYCEAYENGDNGYPANIDAEQSGVILVDSYTDPLPDGGKFRRATLRESYEFVLADLEAARENVDYKDVNNQPYITDSAVEALWARVCLYMQDWKGAVEHSSKVIEDKYLRLSSVNEIYSAGQSYYGYMWTNDQSTESIWKIGFTVTSRRLSRLGVPQL